MIILFVHGWGVTNTSTYGELPEALQRNTPAELSLEVHHIYLGNYISFHDEVKIEDIARAFDKARKDTIGNNSFSCITHSTGGPVIRVWVEMFYGAKKLKKLPLRHLIMLAPPNHGSALAQLGKAKVGRIKAWFQGIEPGVNVLEWLELGSDDQRKLNIAWLNYDIAASKFYPFVITGDYIDKHLYDFLNSYTAESGSDGVVRVCATNLNYRYVRLNQDVHAPPLTTQNNDGSASVYPLVRDDKSYSRSPICPIEVIPKASHSGERYGIMNSVKKSSKKTLPVIKAIVDCLLVNSEKDYQNLVRKTKNRTVSAQGTKDKYTMIVFQVTDDRGNKITDYDMYLLAGKDYKPEKLPKGFFVDRQKNKVNRNQLTYYLNATKMQSVKDGKFGIRIVARPGSGFAYYAPAEFRSDGLKAADLLRENESLLVDIVLSRQVDQNTFKLRQFDPNDVNFKDEKPSGETVP